MIFQGGGLLSTITQDYVDAGGYIRFASSWRINFDFGTCSNITITRGTNSVRVRGFFNGNIISGQPFCQVRVSNMSWEGHTSSIYTVGCDFKENIVRGDAFWYPSISGQGNIFYRNSRSKKPLEILDFPSYATSYTVRCVNYLIDKPGQFDFTVSNPFCYEGAFLNPPYYRSLDVERNNPFLLKEDDEYMRINAPLVRYMATGIDTSAALTTAGCIKDLSGNKNHTRFNSASVNISFVPYVGTVIAPTGTGASAYGGFNSPVCTNYHILNNGNYDELAICTRFRMNIQHSSTNSQNEALGIELTYGNTGQVNRCMYFYYSSTANKIGSNSNVHHAGAKGGSRFTPTNNHVYVGLIQFSIIKGFYREIFKDVTTGGVVYDYSLIGIPKRSEGNYIVEQINSQSLNIFFASGCDMQVIDSALYNQFFSEDEINYLIDNYDPSIGASAVI